MDRLGCGETKGCLFKPAGCDPSLDCTIALIFFVDGPNSLRIEMMAQSLIPPPPLQYIAIAFSNDEAMVGGIFFHSLKHKKDCLYFRGFLGL